MDLTEFEIDELTRLHAVARLCRGNTRPDAEPRIASHMLTEMIADLRDRGVPRGDIASVLGVTPEAITQRLKEHGVLTVAPSQLRFATRVATPKRDACKKGHAFTPENTYTYTRSSDGEQMRECRICKRARSAATYRRRVARAAA